jgi:NAD(P)-dependent dehydrogenase (short-subunit alcohol dehydrogenase family)
MGTLEKEFLSQMRLDGKVAIVTGAGRGLGKQIALSLASVGANVGIIARTRSQLEETAHEIEALGKRVVIMSIDISRSEEVNHAVEQVTSILGPIDILVNNAGITEEKPLLEVTDDDWHHVMGVNLDGAFYFCRAVGRQMVERNRGKVINIGSVLGLVGYQNFASYSTSKGALLQFTRTLALEWARYGINVNAIAFGWFETEMNANAMAQEKIKEALLRRIPFRRFGHPSEVGHIVVFLASSASDFMTGSVIVMDGGELIK